MAKYTLFPVKNYKINNFSEFLKKNGLEFDDVNDLCEELEFNKSYHFRIHKNTKYIFFGDIDRYNKNIETFIKHLQTFVKNHYNISFSKKEFKYTENKKKPGSFHYSIPKWNTTTEKLKEIHTNFLNVFKDEFFNEDNTKVIDTTIYSEHWFRCPNQSKGFEGDETQHVIKNGEMIDFVIDHIPEKSTVIDDVNFLGDNKKKNTKQHEKVKKNTKKIQKKLIKIETNNEKLLKNGNTSQMKNGNTSVIDLICKFVNILSSNYYNDYNDWMKIGMILKYCSIQHKHNFFPLFDDFSKKSLKYKKIDVIKFWNGLNVNKITITIGSLYEFAKKSNSSEYKSIVKKIHEKNRIEITEKYICEKLKEIAGHYFFYLNDTLYSFNNKNNLWYKETTETIKKFISDDLFDYLFYLLNDSIEDETYLKSQVKELKKYCITNKGNIQTLCSRQKLGANPEVANMNQKRYIVFSEPEATEKIHNVMMKELTGSARVNARKLYENKCDVVIPATIVLECNNKITLKNDSTNGEERRIINYTYKSRFTEDVNEIDDDNKIFLAKKISDEFVQKYKYAFMDILIEKANKFINDDGEKFKITENVRKSTEKYISSSFHFFNYLDESTEKTGNVCDFIKIADLYAKFKNSDFYTNSTKEEKRDKLTIKKMKEFFEQNKLTSTNYKHTYDKIINGKRIVAYSVLCGYKFLESD